jgi:hypothetical protein
MRLRGHITRPRVVDTAQPERRLLAAVYLQALHDARRGDGDAAAWLADPVVGVVAWRLWGFRLVWAAGIGDDLARRRPRKAAVGRGRGRRMPEQQQAGGDGEHDTGRGETKGGRGATVGRPAGDGESGGGRSAQ